MRQLWVLMLVVVLAVASASAMSKKPHKKASSDSNKKDIDEMERKLKNLLEMEAELERELEAAAEEEEGGEEEEEVVESSDEENEEILEDQDGEEQQEVYEDPLDFPGDPCLDMYCGAGRTCVINDSGEAECVCMNACDNEWDARRRVCSNFNETWMSDCELYRQRCLCEEGDASCVKPENAHAHIEYYGECQEMPECVEEELEDFPRRMSEWLFNIMRDMADRQTLSQHYVRLEREAEEDPKKQWSYAVVWKWCDLDSHPRDKAVSRHELFPIRAPLFTLENCIGSFLDSCDANSDHSITLQEWANCTKLSVDDLEKFEDFCEEIRDE